MSNTDQFAIIEIPPHGAYRNAIQADAILIGPLSEAMLALKDSMSSRALVRRLDEGERVQAATERQQQQNRTRQILTFCDAVTKLSKRLDSFEVEQAIRKQRIAEEQERQDRLRIRHRLDKLPDPDTPENWGELGEPIPAKTTVEDQVGFASRPVNDPSELAYPPQPKQVGQPISVSLNEE
jgi:hypothetical protein